MNSKILTQKNIPKFIVLMPIITVVIVAFFTIYFFIKYQNDYFKEESIRVEAQYILKQKNILKKELKYIVNYIDYTIKSNKKLSKKELKNKILRYIETIRYGKYGYIWVHNTDYYLLAHPFRKDSIGTFDIDLKDAMGTKITKNFIDETLKNPNGVFIEYYWQKPKDVHFSNKMGFFRLYEKFNWVLGAGLYIDEIQNSIYKNKKLLEQRMNKYIKSVITISFFIVILIGILSYFISKRVTKVFSNYQNSVNKKELELELLNRDLEKKVSRAIREQKRKDRFVLHQSRLARMGTMLSMIAHQWRQPLSQLSGVLMEMETASKFDKLDKTLVKEYINESNKLIEFMSLTIDDFRNFFKPDKRRVSFSIEDSLKEARSLIDASIKNANIELQFDIQSDYKIYGYKREFAQVLLNLMSNAKDILIQRDIENPKIKVKVEKKDVFVHISVSDNARGVKQKNMELIFEPYFTTKSSLQGTGLGLYISKMIIEKNMGGLLSLRNTKIGAEFTIKLRLDNE